MSRRILIFTIAYAVLIISPALLSQQFGPYPLMKTGDVTDILTPLVLIPLYWMLFWLDRPPTLRETIIFLVLAALWSEGQGMHLGANSIGHLLENAKDTDAFTLTHFYDEVLSHYLWHIGVFSLTALLIWRQWRTPFIGTSASLRTEIACGLLLGLVYFITVDEAGTALLGIPFAIVMVIIGWMGRNQLRQQPVTAFFFVAHALALILFVIWFLKWGGLPQFSELGWI
jgi:hypothetical protein